MQAMVAGVWWQPRYRRPDRRDQVGALARRLRCLELHQELRRVSGCREPYAGVDGHDSRQARKPSFHGKLHPYPEGCGGAETACRCSIVRWMGDRSASLGWRLQCSTWLHPVACQGRLPDSVSHDVQPEHHELVPDGQADQRVTHCLRLNTRDGNLRTQRAGCRRCRKPLQAGRPVTPRSA